MAIANATQPIATAHPQAKGTIEENRYLVAEAMREIAKLARALSSGTESYDRNLTEAFTLPAANALAQRIGWLADAALVGLHETPEVGDAVEWMAPDLQSILSPNR